MINTKSNKKLEIKILPGIDDMTGESFVELPNGKVLIKHVAQEMYPNALFVQKVQVSR